MKGGAESTFQEFLWKMGLKWETPKKPTLSTLQLSKEPTRGNTPNAKMNKSSNWANTAISMFPYVFSNSTKSFRTRSIIKSLCVKEIIKK